MISSSAGVAVGMEVACLTMRVLPFEDQAPLIVHADGMIAAQIDPKLFEVIACRHSHVGPLSNFKADRFFPGFIRCQDPQASCRIGG